MTSREIEIARRLVATWQTEREERSGRRANHLNKIGGINPRNESEMTRSKNEDLITLAPDVEGTNCSNCLYFDQESGTSGHCDHEKLHGIPVNERMCCSLWDRKGSIRPWEEQDSREE